MTTKKTKTTDGATAPILNLKRDVATFTQAYIECALWSSTDDGGEPLDSKYNWTHIAADTLLEMKRDCRRFQEQNKSRLASYPTAKAGHDFWLTRNGHGAGFWNNDWGTEEDCEALTKSCKRFGEFNLYVGDDGKIYH